MKAHGSLNVMIPGEFPHSVHFWEGMHVRNFLRSIPECEGWSDERHDFDERWQDLVMEATPYEELP